MVRTLHDAAWLDGVDLVAWVGGEGARWLLGEASSSSVPIASEHGGDAADFALGRAAAGDLVCVLASGNEPVAAMLSPLRQMRALGLRALVVIPSHGDESGAVWPARGDGDVALAATTGCAVERMAGDETVEAFLARASARARAGSEPLVATFALHDAAGLPG